MLFAALTRYPRSRPRFQGRKMNSTVQIDRAHPLDADLGWERMALL
jgi:hypothetical protein